MMKKYFLDCGTHLCEGIINFFEKNIIDNTFEIHAFEANPECKLADRIKKLPYNIIPHSEAVWIEDGKILFNQENHKKSRTGSPTDGISDIDGWGSSVNGIGFDHPGYESQVEVRCIDFSNFLRELPDDSFIVCKMDIEGSEYSVLRKLIQEKTISKISVLYIEFHSRFVKSESLMSEKEIIKQISDAGVKVYDWF